MYVTLGGAEYEYKSIIYLQSWMMMRENGIIE